MSAPNLPRAILEVAYAEAAHEYLRSLTLENHMEATAQGTQRKITLESLDLVHVRRPEVQTFNELLVQYPRRGRKKPGQIVPDNLVVVCEQPIKAEGSYDVPLQPVAPFWVLEYVSKYNKRKDYEDSFERYERELKVPYYLIFYPDNQDLSLYRLTRGKYVSVKPNRNERYSIRELDLEVALHEGWVRYWYQGELLPLPAELQRALDAAQREANEQRQRAEQEREARLAAEREVEALRAQLAALQGKRPNHK